LPPWLPAPDQAPGQPERQVPRAAPGGRDCQNCQGFMALWQFGSQAPPRRRNCFPFLDFPPRGVTAKGVRKLAVWKRKPVPGKKAKVTRRWPPKSPACPGVGLSCAERMIAGPAYLALRARWPGKAGAPGVVSGGMGSKGRQRPGDPGKVVCVRTAQSNPIHSFAFAQVPWWGILRPGRATLLIHPERTPGPNPLSGTPRPRTGPSPSGRFSGRKGG
jgi:hypothetical protein